MGTGGRPLAWRRRARIKAAPPGSGFILPSAVRLAGSCTGGGGGLSPGQPPSALLSARAQHEGLQPGEVGEEEQPVGPRAGHLPEQDPGGRPHEPAVQHERLLLQAQGAGAQHPAEQKGEQDGNPAARHRLHPGPAARPGLAPRHRQPAPPAAGAEPRGAAAADHAQHGRQHPVAAGFRVPLRVHVRRQQSALRLSTRPAGPWKAPNLSSVSQGRTSGTDFLGKKMEGAAGVTSSRGVLWPGRSARYL